MTFEEFTKKVAEFEGFRAHPYDDLNPSKLITNYAQVQGTLTIGYGRTRNVSIGDSTTKEAEFKWLEAELKRLYEIIDVTFKLNKLELTEAQKLALLDFTYNCGKGNLLKLIDYGKRTPQEISEHIILYTKAGGKQLEGLKKRRLWEQELFNSEGYTTKKDYSTCIFEFQAQCNHLIKEYNLPIDKIVTDGIWGVKTLNCINTIIDLISQ